MKGRGGGVRRGVTGECADGRGGTIFPAKDSPSTWWHDVIHEYRCHITVTQICI